jgi:hypothetical protein
MPKKQRGGDLLSALEIGTAVFAAKNAKSYTNFLWLFGKYALMLIVVLFVFGLVYSLVFGREFFSLPQKPSAEGDEKVVTPAGNVILY